MTNLLIAALLGSFFAGYLLVLSVAARMHSHRQQGQGAPDAS